VGVTGKDCGGRKTCSLSHGHAEEEQCIRFTARTTGYRPAGLAAARTGRQGSPAGPHAAAGCALSRQQCAIVFLKHSTGRPHHEETAKSRHEGIVAQVRSRPGRRSAYETRPQWAVERGGNPEALLVVVQRAACGCEPPRAHSADKPWWRSSHFRRTRAAVTVMALDQSARKTLARRRVCMQEHVALKER